MEVGNLVKSKMGHDKDEFFLIFKIIDDDYVLIVNGKTRTLEKPKKKKIKHLLKINKKSDIIERINILLENKEEKNIDFVSQNKKINDEIKRLI